MTAPSVTLVMDIVAVALSEIAAGGKVPSSTTTSRNKTQPDFPNILRSAGCSSLPRGIWPNRHRRCMHSDSYGQATK